MNRKIRAQNLSPDDGLETPQPRGPQEGQASIFDQLGAGVMTQSVVGAAIEETREPAFTDVEGYDALDDPLVEENPRYLYDLVDSSSPAETKYRLERLERQNRQMEMLEAEGASGTLSMVGGALLNPSSAVPFMRFVKTATKLGGATSAAAQTFAVAAGEEAFISSNVETRSFAEAASAVALMTGLGGALGALKKPGRVRAQDLGEEAAVRAETVSAGADSFEAEVDAVRRAAEERPEYRSAGAQAAPGARPQTMAERVAESELVKTGVGVEKLAMNPRDRMLNSSFVASRDYAADMVGTGGKLQAKHLEGKVTRAPITAEFNTEYLPRMVEALVETERQWLKSKGIDVDGAGTLGRQGKVARQRIKGMVEKDPEGLRAFRERVTRANRRGDVDDYSPEVTAAAQAMRRLYDRLGNDALAEGVYEAPLKRKLEEMEFEVRELRKQGAEQTDEVVQELERKIKATQGKIESLRRNGLFANEGRSYAPRAYRQDRIDADYDRLRRVLKDWIGKNRQTDDLDATVEDVIARMRGHFDDHLKIADKDAGETGAARERTLDFIPDEVLEPWLENDAESLARMLTSGLGHDTLLHRRFGSVTMKDQLREIDREAAEALKGTSERQASKIRSQAEADKRDLLELRDRLRGTAGITLDPQSTLASASRLARLMNTMTMSGGFAISAIPDAGAMILKNGLQETLGGVYRSFFDQQSKTLRAMTRDELHEMGTAFEMELGLRAAQLDDTGDPFGRMAGWERGMQQAAGATFALSGLNVINDAMKRVAGTVIAGRMDKAFQAAAKGTLKKGDRANLAAVGIDEEMARRINRQVEAHGETIAGQRMPNTAAWDDEGARRTYRQAMNQEVENTILTPDEGDRATWTTTELGSVVAQFQSFTQAAQSKILTAGLQRRDRAFMEGVAVMVALGGVVHEIKRLQYGDDRQETFGSKMVQAVDRSGVGGLFMTGNQAMERLTGQRMGLQSMTSDTRYPVGLRNVLTTAGGPTGGQADALAMLAKQIEREGINENTLGRLRRFVPGQALPALDPALDQTLGD